ncbi:TetR/AcrR family transcriptional regulator [Nocardia sp. NBC_01327]|uniref:TetR/AcrR family transcriptional regulator n=1 Tax=Nocardia sp. NBC_01327 TaxID=2903593 RepID=UPI002E12350E|nr:TetR/AcrR family transcriptional regulator [Nocardia sp. NBC_01327]
MKESVEKRARQARDQVDKFAERRTQLATAALDTLAELGYARTSLREIAQKSEFSHGVLHYYFSDKVELLTHAVQLYEAVCVTRYDDVVATSDTAEELRNAFSALMAGTLQDDAPLHRLWYDVRNQSLFEESFRADVVDIDKRRQKMIANVVERYAVLCDQPLVVSEALAYATFDGLFQLALLRYHAGEPDAAESLRHDAAQLLDLTIGRTHRV